MTYQPRVPKGAPITVIVTPPVASESITEGLIAPNAITRAKIKDGEVQSEDIGTAQIKTDDIAPGAVTAAKLGADVIIGTIGVGGVTEAMLGSGIVSADKIAGDAVTSVKIATGAVGNDELAADAITAEKIDDQAVENAAIADNTILPGKLSQSAPIVAEEAIVQDTATGKFKSLPLPATSKARSSLFHILKTDLFTVVQGTWAFGVETASYLGGYLFATSLASGDEITTPISIADGTYTIEILHGTSTNRGIMKIGVDATVFGSIDQYSAGGVDNVISTITGVSISGGEKTLRIYTNSKNGASSNYGILFQAIRFVRTGD
jgi:hypothetical protein